MSNRPDHALLAALLKNQKEYASDNIKVVLTPYGDKPSCDSEIITAWRVLKQEPNPGGIKVIVDPRIEQPDVEPLVLFRWPEGVLKLGSRHLVLWRDGLWWCARWKELETGISGVADFSRFTMPLMRNIYPQLLTNKLVDVRPLTQPANLIAYIRNGLTRSTSI